MVRTDKLSVEKILIKGWKSAFAAVRLLEHFSQLLGAHRPFSENRAERLLLYPATAYSRPNPVCRGIGKRTEFFSSFSMGSDERLYLGNSYLSRSYGMSSVIGR